MIWKNCTGCAQLYCGEQLLIFMDAADNDRLVRVDLGSGNVTPLVG
jgi:hypothetical protein